MEIFKEAKPLKAYLKGQRVAGKSIGLVPTMGALHAGHLSLLKVSKHDNNITVCSIFVNPAQFNNPADLASYPRTPERDMEILRQNQCEVVFLPGEREMYGDGSTVQFDFGPLDKILEGKFRPGHFSGVALAVSKLFNIVAPDVAYFGQKDFQQCLIIDSLRHDLKFDLQLRYIPIHREKDGLAMSSRNLRLSASQRKMATVFHQALQFARKKLQDGESVDKIHSQVKNMCETKEGVRLEYFAVANRENLNELTNVNRGDKVILLIAGYVGEIRLIDNLMFNDED